LTVATPHVPSIVTAVPPHISRCFDPNALTRALELDFRVDANAGLGAIMRSGARQQGSSGMRVEQQADTSDPETLRDTLTGRRPTTTPTPQNAPPR
jgi:hypothetical protein